MVVIVVMMGMEQKIPKAMCVWPLDLQGYAGYSGYDDYYGQYKKIQLGQIIGSLEWWAMPHLLSLQGYGGYSGYHVIMVIKQKDCTCGQLI